MFTSLLTDHGVHALQPGLPAVTCCSLNCGLKRTLPSFPPFLPFLPWVAFVKVFLPQQRGK